MSDTSAMDAADAEQWARDHIYDPPRPDDIVPPWLQNAAKRARRAEEIADDVVEEYVSDPAHAHRPVELALLDVALLAARRGLGFPD